MSTALVDQQPPIKLSRQERKQRTRQRLIDAVIDIVCEEGIEALTTTRLTQCAQITQPGFYVHFRNIDHCLSVAAERILERLVQLQAEARKSAYDKIRAFHDIDKTDLIPLAIVEMLRAVLSEPRLSMIYVHYRHDRSPLGQSMRRVTEHLRLAIMEDVLRLVKNAGVSEPDHPRYALSAEVLTSVYIGALEAAIEQRCTDNGLMSDVLSHFVKQAVVAELNHGSGS